MATVALKVSICCCYGKATVGNVQRERGKRSIVFFANRWSLKISLTKILCLAMKKISLILILFLSFLLTSAYSIAGEHQQCQLCGMDLNKYRHVRYTVSTLDKKQISTCGVQCGLLMQLNLAEKFDSATATTLLEHRTIPAQDAWYVFKSSVITDMSPGFIAFLTEDQALRFVKGYGGKVVDFKQAMSIVKNGFK